MARADATPLDLVTRHVRIDRGLERYIRGRAARKLAKFAYNEEQITVRFDDVNGPKKGVDIVCRITVKVPHARDIVVAEPGTEPREAFDLAIDRTETAVKKYLEKKGRSGKAAVRVAREVKEKVQHGPGPKSPRSVAADGSVVGDRRPRTMLGRAPKAMVAKEDSATGHASRKSTRRSANRAKSDSQLYRKKTHEEMRPETRAGRRRRGKIE